VLPIVVSLKVGLDGVGVHSHGGWLWNLEMLRFQYLYVGLPGLDRVQYMQGDNWLGVALSALTRIPPDRVAWLGAEAPLSEQERFLLSEIASLADLRLPGGRGVSSSRRGLCEVRRTAASDRPGPRPRLRFRLIWRESENPDERCDGRWPVCSSFTARLLAVRYGWTANPERNLVNSAGLLASRSRADQRIEPIAERRPPDRFDVSSRTGNGGDLDDFHRFLP